MGTMFPSLQISKGSFVPAVPGEAPMPRDANAAWGTWRASPRRALGVLGIPAAPAGLLASTADPTAHGAVPELFLDDTKPCSSKLSTNFTVDFQLACTWGCH